MRLSFCLILLLIFTSPLFAQSSRQNQFNELMKMGKEQVKAKEYEQANMTFRRILTLDQTIPSEFCYYFATTLFHIGQFRNSRSFINKYYEIAGQGGEFSTDIKHLEKQVNAELKKIEACNLCDNNGYRYELCQICDGSGNVSKQCATCKGKGKTICSLCSGEGVVIRRNVFNSNEYHTCGRCKGTGIAACPTCEGSTMVESLCSECRGVGGTPTGGICDHIPHVHETTGEIED
jgi:hypothetical protein